MMRSPTLLIMGGMTLREAARRVGAHTLDVYRAIASGALHAEANADRTQWVIAAECLSAWQAGIACAHRPAASTTTTTTTTITTTTTTTTEPAHADLEGAHGPARPAEDDGYAPRVGRRRHDRVSGSMASVTSP